MTFCSLLLTGSIEIVSSPIFRKIFTLIVEIQAFNHLKKNHTILSPLLPSKNEAKRKADLEIVNNTEIEIEENKEKDDVSSKNDDLDSIDYNESQSFQYQFEHPSQKLEFLMRTFINPLKKENEIEDFQETMRKLKTQKKEVYDLLLDELSEKNKSKFHEIMTLRKIDDTEGGKEHHYNYRKIFRIKGKKNKQVNFENHDMEYKDSLYLDFY